MSRKFYSSEVVIEPLFKPIKGGPGGVYGKGTEIQKHFEGPNLPRILPLTKVPLGRQAYLISKDVFGALGERLTDLGFTPGAELMPIRWGPRQNLIAISIRNSTIALRRKEAEGIAVGCI